MLNSSVVSDSLRPHALQPARLLCPWDSPSRNTGVGCQTLLLGIFPTQGLNSGLPPYRRILYQLSHQGDILGWFNVKADSFWYFIFIILAFSLYYRYL